MKYRKRNERIYALFDEGEDPFKNLEELYGIAGSNLVIIMGMGMLEDPELGYFTGNGYEKKVFKGRWELLSLTGNIVKGEPNPEIHVHAVLGGPDHNVAGGHLFAARVAVMNEIVLFITGEDFMKKPSSSGLKKWEL